MVNSKPVVVPTDVGLYCEAGDFHIDPWRPVPRALVTHAHSDHLTRGCGSYLIAKDGEHVTRARLEPEASVQTLAFGRSLRIKDVTVSFHPAGHILGSAQIRVAHRRSVSVVSGDYKVEVDRTCAAYEPVACDHFISEATFALPIYRWVPQQQIFSDINAWWAANAADGRASIVYGYALGKLQRVLGGVDASIGPIFSHGAVERMTQAYRATGVALPATQLVRDAPRGAFERALIVAPVSARGSTWVNRFGAHASAFVSGWMQIRGARRRRAVDRGFVLSDHADWLGLLSAIEGTGASRIGVTHGYTAVLSRWLEERGIDAYAIDTRYSGESLEGESTTDGVDSIEGDTSVAATNVPADANTPSETLE